MFLDATTYHNRNINNPPDFDLANCTNASRAFKNFRIQRIRLKNAEKITSAAKMIQGCDTLEEFPDLMFDRKNGLGVFGIDEAEQVEDMFKGCRMLHAKGAGYRDQVAALVKYYVDDLRELPRAEDGSVIVKSHRDATLYAADYRSRYSKGDKAGWVKAEPDKNGSARSLFADIEGLTINRLDLTGVRDATGMFRDAEFDYLGEIAGTESLKTVDMMFAGSDITETPRANFPNATSAAGIFAGCRRIRDVGFEPLEGDALELYKKEHPGKEVPGPFTKFGQFAVPLTDDMEAPDPAEYLFGSPGEAWPPENIKRIDPDRIGGRMYGVNMKDAARNGAVEWRAAHSAGKGFLILDFGDVTRYQKIKERFGDDIAGFELYTVSPAAVEKGLGGGTVDFGGIPVDLSQVDNIAGIFQSSKVSRPGKFVNCGGLKIIDRAFSGAAVEQGDIEFDTLDAVETASDAFAGCRGGVLKNTSFKSLKEADCMFDNTDVLGKDADVSWLAECKGLEICGMMFHDCKSKLKIKDLSLPAANDCTRMFEGAKLAGPAIESVDLPACTKATGMFADTDVKEVGGISAPRVADAEQMFKDSDLASLGVLKTPALRNAKEMFAETDLEWIADFDLDFKAVNFADAFKGAPIAEMYGDDGVYLKLYMNDQKV